MQVTRARRSNAAKRLALLALAVACAASAASLAPRAAAAGGSDKEKIVYHDLDGNLFLMNADGTGVKPLGRGHSPAWSPDARRIVFADSPEDPESSYVFSMNADGTGRARLSDGPADSHPSYSPDGRRVIFVSEREDSAKRLYVMNADGSGERRLFASGLRAETVPAYSPDGRAVAFVGQTLSAARRIEYNVYVVGADGAGLRQLTDGLQLDPGDTLAFSPDGRAVIYTHGRDLMMVRTDGAGRPVNLTNSADREEYGPAYSPGGDKIACAESLLGRDAPDGIYVMNLADRSVVYTNARGRNPRWMPKSAARQELAQGRDE
jgi:Tol biopolymer transport system component